MKILVMCLGSCLPRRHKVNMWGLFYLFLLAFPSCSFTWAFVLMMKLKWFHWHFRLSSRGFLLHLGVRFISPFKSYENRANKATYRSSTISGAPMAMLICQGTCSIAQRLTKIAAECQQQQPSKYVAWSVGQRSWSENSRTHYPGPVGNWVSSWCTAASELKKKNQNKAKNSQCFALFSSWRQ